MAGRTAATIGGLAVLAGVVALGFSGCSNAVDPWKDAAGPPRVVVTIAPLYSFVKAVGGDRVGVKCLCLDKGPHHFTYDVRDAQLLQGADLFLAVGLTLDDHFADKLAAQAANPRLRYVRLGKLLPDKLLIKLAKPIDHGDHQHTGFDPHVWLGIEQAVAMVRQIRDELTRADPAGEEVYSANAEKYAKALRKLHGAGKEMLAKKSNKRLITFHESLAYFARSFGLQIVDVIQFDPGGSVSPVHLRELIALCKKDPVGAIAVEPQYPKYTSAVALQKELGSTKVPLVEVDPLETADKDQLIDQGADWYLFRMRANLKALADHLP
jgi:ABC-type Zn uptake system ZnuABC Zn-binding protein ZnuA